jgi:hypothetical protein
LALALGVLVAAAAWTFGSKEPSMTLHFSGQKAFRHVQAQVALGPRPAGSQAAARTRQYLRSQLEPLGYAVEEQAFRPFTPAGPLPMANLIATLPGATGPLLVLAAHYDTKRFDFPFVGANDGASGTACVLELGRALAAEPLRRHSVALVFLDGEEAVATWTVLDSLYGSRHLVSQWSQSGRLARVEAVVVLDMVGDRDLRLTRDVNSTGWLLDLLFREGRRLGYGPLLAGPEMPVEDDHVPFLRADVPAALLIGFAPGYPAYWHTAGDTLDKVSPQSLEAAGRMAEATLRGLDQE